MSCHCGNDAPFETCCEPYIAGKDLPATAELLMRSRYSAYASNAIDYIATTHEPSGRDEVDLEAAKSWSENAEWLGLEIVSTEAGGEGDVTGVVEFIARYAIDGVEQRHHEKSTFRKSNDRWFYVDGDMVKAKPVVREAPKVGRNEPCTCGSGKKFKKCCGKS